MHSRPHEDRHTFPAGASPGKWKLPDELGVLQGTLDLLVLKVLTWGPQHGYAIASRIKDHSANALVIEDRALYLSLHRLEERGWVDAEWGVSDSNRRARYYRITAAGRRQLRLRISNWTRYADAVFNIIRADESASG
jgi:PadR family transcriptional regulator